MTTWTKDGVSYTLSEIKARHLNTGFVPGTPEFLGYVADPEPEPQPAPAPTAESLQRSVAWQVSMRLNAKAQEYRYDDIKSANAARDSHIAKFSAEGQAFYWWWGETWAYIDTAEADYVAAVTAAMAAGDPLPPLPSEESILAGLPEFVPPVY